MNSLKLHKKLQEKILKEIQHNNIATLENLKVADPDFHWSSICYEKTGDTALHVASRLGYVSVINYLLKDYTPCTVDVKNRDDKTALHEAAQFAQLDSVSRLCSLGADVNALRRGDWTSLMLACTKVEPETSLNIVKCLVERGAKINICNKDGWTCVHLLARDGGEDIFDHLVIQGLKVNVRTKNGRTPLHIASLHGNNSILPRLLHHIDIDTQDGCGNTPLHEAVLGQHIDIARWLVEHGANVNIQNNSDLSVLHLAASQDSPEIINYVLNELNFNINCQNKNGWTVSHCAARKRSKAILEYLDKLGADFSIKDNFGRTATDYYLL